MKKRFKIKIVLPLAALAPSLLALGGCSAYVESEYRAYDPEVDGDPTALSAKVTFWHTMSQQGQKMLDDQIKAFNEIYPNIKIEHSAQGDYNGIKDKLVKAIPAGTTPTMAYCYPDHVAEYLFSGATEEMGQYANDSVIGFGKDDTESGGAADFVQEFWKEGQVYEKEGIYSLPYAKSTEVIFYNKTEFDKKGYTMPKTWDGLWSLCRQIKSDYSSLEDFVPLGINSDSNMFITFCEQMGIPYTSAQGDHYLFSNDQAKAMIHTLKSYYDEHLFITEGTSENNNYTSNRFVKGAVNNGCLMFIGSTGGTSYGWPGSPAKTFEVAVATPPSVDESKPAVITQGPSITFFKRASLKEKYAAWLFYKWITNTDNSAEYALLTGYEPVRQSSYQTEAYQDMLATPVDPNSDDKTMLFAAVAKTTMTMQSSYFSSPVFVGSSKAREAVGEIFPAVALNQKTVDEAFNEAISRCVFSQND